MKNRNYCQDHTALVHAVEAVEQEASSKRKEDAIAVVLACIVIILPVIGGMIAG